ncbi:alpha/beta hydrolase [Larkinella harenae]
MSNKPVIVLIHGHGVDSSIWKEVHDSLATEYAVVKPDFSTNTNHETIEAYAEDLFSQLQSSQIESCILVGHSMGGYIALAFAEQHPNLVDGLILVNSTAFADTEEKKQARQKAIETMEENGSGAFIEQTVPKMFGEEFSQRRSEDVKTYVAQFSELPAEALIAGVKAIAARPERVQVLQNASFPVLIIAGRQDQIIPFDKSQELFDKVPGAQTVVLNNAGHLGMIESSDELINAIRNFVNKR